MTLVLVGRMARIVVQRRSLTTTLLNGGIVAIVLRRAHRLGYPFRIRWSDPSGRATATGSTADVHSGSRY